MPVHKLAERFCRQRHPTEIKSDGKGRAQASDTKWGALLRRLGVSIPTRHQTRPPLEVFFDLVFRAAPV